MINAEETRRQKAKNLRYKKPIVKGLNLDDITQSLYDMQEECENVRWYFEGDDDTLINALDGDDDEAYEFKMMFGDLCAVCERMDEDLRAVMRDDEIKDAFNIWFPAIQGGDMIGWDTYETDYMPIEMGYEQEIAGREGRKRVMRMTKEQILDLAALSFRIVRSYLGLMSRYDQLKAAMDILRDQNTGYLQAVKEIEKMYEEANTGWGSKWGKAEREWRMYTDTLPQEAWIQ